jgi:hypothetical protein
VELELVECQPLLEWLANNYKSFGATLEIITDKSQEGSQFVRGFGGIGGKFIKYFIGYILSTMLYGMSCLEYIGVHNNILCFINVMWSCWV